MIKNEIQTPTPSKPAGSSTAASNPDARLAPAAAGLDSVNLVLVDKHDIF
jgi:hypothetical protein